MCSIAGVYWFGSNKPSCNKLSEMVKGALDLLKNRGPDESSLVVVQDNCVMGGNRLIIRGDLGKGNMPFRYGKSLLFYNGEIYNYKTWNKDALSDGEIILPLYDRFNIKAFSKLNGEFAVSLWDGVEKNLFLVRDQFGTKPIYFSLNTTVFYGLLLPVLLTKWKGMISASL